MDELEYQLLPLTPEAGNNFKRLEEKRFEELRHHVKSSPNLDVAFSDLTEGRLRDYYACLIQSGEPKSQCEAFVREYAKRLPEDSSDVLQRAGLPTFSDARLDYSLSFDFDAICDKVLRSIATATDLDDRGTSGASKPKSGHSTLRKRVPKRDVRKAAERDAFIDPFLRRQTLCAFACRSGVGHSSLFRWRSGESKLTPENLGKLADALKVDQQTIPN
jgi:hypothetical protein